MTNHRVAYVRQKARRIRELAPQVLQNPAHIQAALQGVNVAILGGMDKPWMRELAFGTVLDVGANTGQFAKALHYLFPAAYIYSFEPLPGCYKQLVASMHGCERFKGFPVAIGGEDGMVVIHQSSSSPSSSILPMTSKHTEAFPWTAGGTDLDVPVRTLDSFLPELRLEGKVLLKIDVQGYGLHVLRGATKTLSSVHMVLIETSFVNLYDGEATFDEIYAFMVESSYAFVGFLGQLEHPRSGAVLQADALFRRTGVGQ